MIGEPGWGLSRAVRARGAGLRAAGVRAGDVTTAPTGDGNNTAAYVCRRARGQSR